MRQKFDSERRFGGRQEYSEQSTADHLTECLIVTEMIDELLETNYDSGGTIASSMDSSRSGISHFRSFQYLDTDTSGSFGFSWPLVEKTIDIRYIRTHEPHTNEQYHVAIGTQIHQTGVSKDPILNIYQISYYGKNRESAVTTIDEPDIVGAYEFNYTTRPTTSYDHNRLFTELGYLSDMLQAQERENSYLSP